MKVYDNYEISPCKRFEEPDSPGKFYFEVCEPDVADVWTLYGHIEGEGVEALGDFSTREAAEQTFQRITGIPFGTHEEVAARLRVMHAGPKMIDRLRKASAALHHPERHSVGTLWSVRSQIDEVIAEATGKEAA